MGRLRQLHHSDLARRVRESEISWIRRFHRSSYDLDRNHDRVLGRPRFLLPT
jgi:hypothetical protein